MTPLLPRRAGLLITKFALQTHRNFGSLAL
jgi:hypothetical protein